MSTSKLVIPIELFTAFNEVKYFDIPHQYFINNQEYVSVTTLIHKYQEEFDENYWSAYKANEFNLSQAQIKRAWDFINRKGTMKGSIIHDYSENLIQNKIFEYPKDEILTEFGFDPILEEFEITKKLVDRFHHDIKGKLIPIKAEQIVYDKKALIAGTFDILFWNKKAQEFQIWDNKTNKKFTTENKSKNLLNRLSLLEDCDMEIYSLQLELYKQIIERNTSIKLGKSYVVWFSHHNEKYEIIEMKDRKYFVDIIFEDRINSLSA